MAILTIRQKQYVLGRVLLALLGMAALALVWRLYTGLPWLAWPLTAVLAGGAVWWFVRARRRYLAGTARRRPRTLEVTVPLSSDDDVDSVTLKLLEEAQRRGHPVSVAQARRVAEAELRKVQGGTAAS